MRSLRPSPRRGVALVLAVTCLFVLTIVLGSLIRMGVSERRQARAEERLLRAVWLAESGLERAWARLSEMPDYRGETWEILAESLGGDQPAVVTIVAEPVPNAPARRLVRVQANYPSSGSSRARHTRTIEFDLPASDSRPGENR